MDARTQAKQQFEAATAARIGHLLAQVDAAAAALPGSAARLKSWAAAEHGWPMESGKPSDMARELIAFFKLALADDFRDKFDKDERDESAQKRQRAGQRAGRLRAAVAELEALRAERIISTRELATLTKALDEIGARLTLPTRYKPDADAGRPAAPGVTLGAWLMSLMLAVGYGSAGRQYRDTREYSAAAAARIVAELVKLNGYGVTVQQLRNSAVKQRAAVAE